MGKVKKFISGILAAVMCISVMPIVSLAESEIKSDKKYAEYTFDKKDVNKNIRNYWIWETRGSGRTTATYQGKKGLWLGANANVYMSVNIEDKYWYSEEAETVGITVEYFDEGASNSFFAVRYNGNDGKYQPSDVVRMTGTNEWKTATIVIDDMKVCNGSDAADFVITTWTSATGHSGGGVFIHSVKAEQMFPTKPIKASATSEHLGNVFDVNDEKQIDLTFENITEYDGTVQADYVVKDENNKVLKEGKTENIQVAARSTEKYSINLDLPKCGLYTIDYKYSGEVPRDDEVAKFDFEDYGLLSVGLLSKPGDETNSNYWIGAHAYFYNPYNSPEKTMEMIVKGGWGGNRSGFFGNQNWEWQKNVNGNYIFEWDSDAELLRKNNQSVIEIAGFGRPSIYNDPNRKHKFYMPRTQDEIAEYTKYCVQLAEAYDEKKLDKPFRLEVWNEPNNAHFNYAVTQEDAEYYANLLKAVYPAVKKASPNTIVVGMVTVGADITWISDVLSYGAYDYLDELCIHPYSWGKGKAKFDSIISDTNTLKEEMKKYGDLKPIIFSEIGWHDTGYMNETGSLSGNSMGVTSEEQAKNTVVLPVICKAYDLTDIVCWYDLQNDGEISTNSEHNFGLLESPYNKTPYAAKPSYLASCAYNRLMPNATYINKIEHNGLQTAAYMFKRTKGDNIAVMWTYDSNASLTINLGCKQAEIVDLYGNSKGIVSSESGVYTFNLVEEPMYVIGKFTCFEDADNRIISISDFSESVPNDTIPIEVTDELGRNLSVELTFEDDALTAEGNTSVINGKANFDLKSADNTLGEHFVDIRVYDNEKNYYIGRYSVWIKNPFSITTDTKQMFDSSTNRWQAVVTMKNLAYTAHLNGSISLTAPEDYAKSANSVNVVDLRPKEERTFYINLPEMVKKRTQDITISASLDNGFSEEYKTTVDFTTAFYAQNKPTLDGNIEDSEWQGDWVYSDRRENVEGDGIVWGGPDDLSQKAKFMWDEDNIYLAVVVKDNIFSQEYADANAWQGDGIQFGFEDINPQGKYENTSFTEFGVSLYKGKIQGYRWSTLYDIPTGVVDNVSGVIKRNEDTKETIYEISIPWSEIFNAGYDITKINALGFSYIVNDNDGTGRRGWIKYNGGIGIVKNAKEFGRMRLLRR